jgi:hypothetical protein
MASDAELEALLTKITDEMSHEVYRAGNHPALGVDRETVTVWRDLLIDARAALASPGTSLDDKGRQP